MGVATDGNPWVGRHRAAPAALPARPPRLPSHTQELGTHLWNILSPGRGAPGAGGTLLPRGSPWASHGSLGSRTLRRLSAPRQGDRREALPSCAGRGLSQANGEQLTKEESCQVAPDVPACLC